MLKADAKSDLKHVRSLINTRLEALETELDEIKSTRATKSITNRLTEQTGLLRTKIDELKNKLDRELNEASDDLKDEIKGNFTVLLFFKAFGSKLGFDDIKYYKLEFSVISGAWVDFSLNQKFNLLIFVSEIEETMKTDLSMVKDMLSNVQNSQERVSSNQGELQQTLRVLQIEDSGIRNELGQLSADVNRRLNYKEDKISDHSKVGLSID